MALLAELGAGVSEGANKALLLPQTRIKEKGHCICLSIRNTQTAPEKCPPPRLPEVRPVTSTRKCSYHQTLHPHLKKVHLEQSSPFHRNDTAWQQEEISVVECVQSHFSQNTAGASGPLEPMVSQEQLRQCGWTSFTRAGLSPYLPMENMPRASTPSDVGHLWMWCPPSWLEADNRLVISKAASRRFFYWSC